MSGQDEGFLNRWSRRKRAGLPDEPATDDVSEGPGETDAPPEDETEEQALERLGLPDPDTMKSGDDFAAFMKAAVPEALRRRALRKLWRSNPVLANLDGLNDYDGDFTGGTVARGELKTLYKVGRGFLTDEPDAASAPPEVPEAEEASEAGYDAEKDAAATPGTETETRTATGTCDDDPEPGAKIPQS